jgi:hypothetical protein
MAIAGLFTPNLFILNLWFVISGVLFDKVMKNYLE